MNWYSIVSKDLTKLPDFIAYYEDEIKEARYELTLKGHSLEKHASQLPGIFENRFSQLQVIEAVLEYLNTELKKIRADSFRKLMESNPRALSTTEANKYVDGDVDVYNQMLLVNRVALVRNQFLAVHKGLEQKSWMIGHITKLRCAGLDDAMMD